MTHSYTTSGDLTATSAARGVSYSQTVQPSNIRLAHPVADDAPLSPNPQIDTFAGQIQHTSHVGDTCKH